MPKNAMQTQIIPNIQAAFVAVFDETEKMLEQKTTKELQEISRQATDVHPNAIFSFRLAAQTLHLTAEKIIESRKAPK